MATRRIGPGGAVPEPDPAHRAPTPPADATALGNQGATGALSGLGQGGKSERGSAGTSASFGHSGQSVRPYVSQKQVDALMDSIRQIGDLPEAERLRAFNRVYIQALRLHDHQRAGPLAELVGQFGGLPQADSPHLQPLFPSHLQLLFQSLFDEILRLPENQLEGLPAKLIRQIRVLPFPGKPLAFQRVLERTTQLPDHLRGEPLAALANEINFALRDVDQPAMYERIFEETLRLPDDQRNVPLAALARMSAAVQPEAALLRTFYRVFDEVLRLPDDQRGPPLAALAGQLAWQPEDRRLPSFELIFNQHFRLPDDQRGELLAALAGALGWLPEAHRQWTFVLVVEQALHLPDEHLGRPLALLTRQVGLLPEGLQQQALADLVDQVVRVPEDQRSQPLVELACVVGSLPIADRQRGFERILNEIRDGRPLAALTSQIRSVPQAQRLPTLERVIDPILGLNDDELLAFEDYYKEIGFDLPSERVDLLAALVKQVAEVPQAGLQPAFERCVDSVVRLPADQQARWLPALRKLATELPAARQREATAMLARFDTA